MGRAYIGLGSNLGDPRENVEAASRGLAAVGTIVARSSLYRSKAWGVREQPDFINAALILETPLEPRALLGTLQTLEKRLGRTESYRWGPRIIDLDILAYAGVTLDEPGLILPHPRLGERAFALAPLAEIEPAYREAYERLPEEARAEVWRICGPC